MLKQFAHALMLSALFALLQGCATPPSAPDTSVSTTPRAPEPATAPQPGAKSSIDLPMLARTLKLDRNIRELGFEEQGFNPCDHGYWAATAQKCQRHHLVVLHFQLQCRDTDGTVQYVEMSKLTPVVSNQVKWSIGNLRGLAETDQDGYGQIRVVASNSQREKKLRLAVGGNFLILTAGETRRIVAPKSWCTE